DTEVNHDIDPYLDGINEVLTEFSKEELIKKVFSVEFTRFYNYYKNSKDLSVAAGDRDRGSDQPSIRFFINLGGKDDFDWMSLKDFLRDLLQLSKDDLYKVDVMDSFSFFNVDEKHKDMVMHAFESFKLNGRQITVEISKEGRRKGGGRPPRKGKRDYKKKGRSFSNEGGKFKGKSRRRNQRPNEKGTGGRRRRR
ncbi:MAG: DbpA RNA binding domain-containing protein, partial [Bacteroidia bacterium]|nr:DbpA RNA binding domain-containing protein [Bacteroidia bacterium]